MEYEEKGIDNILCRCALYGFCFPDLLLLASLRIEERVQRKFHCTIFIVLRNMFKENSIASISSVIGPNPILFHTLRCAHREPKKNWFSRENSEIPRPVFFRRALFPKINKTKNKTYRGADTAPLRPALSHVHLTENQSLCKTDTGPPVRVLPFSAIPFT